MKELTPRARAKREQILQAARALFLERGFAGTSTDALATTAGVSKETLYTYFPSKEALLAAVLEHLIADFSRQRLAVPIDAPRINSPAELRQTLLLTARRILDSLMQPDYLALVRVIVAELPRFPQLGELFRMTVAEQVLQNAASLLERAQQVVREVDREAAARMFVGPLLIYVLLDGLLTAGEARRPPPERIEAIIDLYLAAIV
jgi:TetR/AcrR family transcriptional repressor of mexJK operon